MRFTFFNNSSVSTIPRLGILLSSYFHLIIYMPQFLKFVPKNAIPVKETVYKEFRALQPYQQ
ncbi:hypothetical protein FHS60_000055 [Alloprevotella rava]|uniref:Uncharacterized protein n=1 Tax=Alloprevotella rava TaxID=671218 RepID=A0A7W5UCR9_9BACT|nr:hypothetical protein [Alloprevotella rava]